MSAQNNKVFKPPQRVIEAINTVWEYYGVGKEEAKLEKARILNNYDDAVRCCRTISPAL